MFKNLNYFLRTLVLALLVGLGLYTVTAVNGIFQDHREELAQREERIVQLNEEVKLKEEEIQLKEQEIQQLEAALKLLKVDHRVARIKVVDQSPVNGETGQVQTTLLFQELGLGGQALGPAAEISLLGRVAYLDAMVIKFEDSYVEKGDFLRGTSICFFRRLFGEFQRPNEGFPIDAVGTRPRAYSPEETDPAFEDDLWSRFWDYANDRQLAESMGVRAVQGEAPYMELRPGKIYRVELRASGGLSILADN